ncbi:hypothetical protein [Pseudochryseolinea flava]|uniref:Glycosyltransferase RgtA/B/C/D-like domain-containing protein n=1 Tax=Pseudochryseolinea flava TaxID=2059302 RepID=A0A364Y3P4_9BACT|nr:hypothetical protein [Pseudochryseolinea flava]RAW01339.1 hypothetical protein DQQ10_10565 [Pseudochryseolinea flava]
MRKDFIVLIAGLILLSATAVFNPNGFVFDEVLFPPNVLLMEEHGFGKTFLLEMIDQAPGPLYEFIHLPLKGITKLEPRAMRIVNLILFFLIICILVQIYRQSEKKEHAIYLGLHIIAITTLWQVAGLVLTEMPAMLFATTSFLIGVVLLNNQDDHKKVLLYSVLMGITGGLAILGRTPYLVILPAFFGVLVLIRFFKVGSVPIAKAFIPYAVIALSMIIPIFLIWGGMVPPLQPKVEGAIQPWHGLLACAYAGVIGFIIYPKWFVFNNTILMILAGAYVFFFTLGLMELGYEYAPMATTVIRIAGLNAFNMYVKLISPLLATFGFYFLVCCWYRGKENLNDAMYLFALLTSLAILASSAKISHQFSSRYVAQAAPFLVILFAKVDEKDNWRWIRLAIGITMGFLSLNTYAKVI